MLVSLVPFGAFVVRADMNDAYELVIEVRREFTEMSRVLIVQPGCV